jgi:glycosyltransferase involved in cell wall biosynthesis
VRILVCSLEAPLPPVNGLLSQVLALVRELRKEHRVRVLAYRMPDQVAPATSDDIRLLDRRSSLSRWWDVTAAFPPGTARDAIRLRKPLREELESLNPDVVHVTSGRLAALGYFRRLLDGRPAVLAALDAWHLNVEAAAEVASGPERTLRRIEGLLVRRFERLAYKRFHRVVVVSEEDRRALLEVRSDLPIEVIPNGVDAVAYDWDGSPRDRNLILFTGVMTYGPNVAAAEYLARRILPRVQQTNPSARLALVGRNPAPEVLVLAGLPGVEVVGEVPDMRPWLSRAGVFACPMLTGTGIKNKLLEAMANGLPCVATPRALQGLSARVGEEVLGGSTEEDFARDVSGVMRDVGFADRVGSDGREYVRARHTWASVAEHYVRVYREAGSRESP